MGIAHDIFADPTSPGKRWEVDLVPLILSSDEWHALEAALVQRARLLNAILADIYGEQRLMREGLDPAGARLLRSRLPERLPGHRAGSRASAVLRRRSGARGERQLARHRQSHRDAGRRRLCARQPRRAHAHRRRSLPEVQRAAARAVLPARAGGPDACSRGRRDPRIALLTPGPHHDDYFSHAYLARYLGYLLVEAGDLRTAGDRVFLKTLEGLKRIDLIVRCVDGRAMRSARARHHALWRPAGSGARLPQDAGARAQRARLRHRRRTAASAAICRAICQQRARREAARRRRAALVARRRRRTASTSSHNLDRMVIRPAQEGTGRPGGAQYGRVGASADGGRAPRARRGDRAARRRARRRGAHRLRHDAGVHARRASFRSRSPSACSSPPPPTASRSCRAASPWRSSPNLAVALSAPEARTRDVWVISDGEVPPHRSLWQPTIETARVQRSQRVIQSRVADDLFWLGRYGERTDWIMRVLRSALQRLRERQRAVRRAGRRARLPRSADPARRGAEPSQPSERRTRAAIERMVRLLISARRTAGARSTARSTSSTASRA